MSRSNRIAIYKKIESHRKSPLIVYVTSKREGAAATMATDVLPYIIEQLDAISEDTKSLDFLIVSYGGDPMVAWRIMSLIRQRVKKVSVLIPQSAYSAATLLAFGGNEIVMHPNGHLGPVDMQITTYNEGRARSFSTEQITAFLDFVRDNLKITDQEHIRTLFESICKEVGSLGIGFTARSSKLAADLGERLLAFHMKERDGSPSKLRTMVESMSRKFQSHSYPVNRTEAQEIGLPIGKRDKVLESLMWELWLDIEEELKERIPFKPLQELLNNAEGAKLFSPVPQLDLPPNAATPNHFSSDLDKVRAASVKIEPVDFEIRNAIVESARMTHSCITRGKILACRNPNLAIAFNAVTTSRAWEKQLNKAKGA